MAQSFTRFTRPFKLSVAPRFRGNVSTRCQKVDRREAGDYIGVIRTFTHPSPTESPNPMKLFISWSGNRSRVFAQGFAVWIRCVIQAARPWISTEDIPGGSNWFNQISSELSATSTGIICLTKENFRNEWIMFESGALFKGLPSNRLYTILIDLEVDDLVNSPLSAINHTKSTKTQVRKLVHDLNQQMGDHALDQLTLEKVFETYWKDFEALLKNTTDVPADHEKEKANEVSEKDMIAELLSLARRQTLVDERVRDSHPTTELSRIIGDFHGLRRMCRENPKGNYERRADRLIDKLKTLKTESEAENRFVFEMINEIQLLMI